MAMFWEVGGHQADRKPSGQALANKFPLNWGRIPAYKQVFTWPIIGFEGIIEPAYADSSEDGESRLSSCLKKINSTAELKRKPDKIKIGRSDFAS
jgi:hypothetical protein